MTQQLVTRLREQSLKDNDSNKEWDIERIIKQELTWSSSGESSIISDDDARHFNVLLHQFKNLCYLYKDGRTLQGYFELSESDSDLYRDKLRFQQIIDIIRRGDYSSLPTRNQRILCRLENRGFLPYTTRSSCLTPSGRVKKSNIPPDTDADWNIYFMLLQQYHRTHGHYNVPLNERVEIDGVNYLLGLWMKREVRKLGIYLQKNKERYYQLAGCLLEDMTSKESDETSCSSNSSSSFQLATPEHSLVLFEYSKGSKRHLGLGIIIRSYRRMAKKLFDIARFVFLYPADNISSPVQESEQMLLIPTENVLACMLAIDPGKSFSSE